MGKLQWFVFITAFMFVLLLAFGTLTSPAQAGMTEPVYPTPTGTPSALPGNPSESLPTLSIEEQNELKKVIHSYFELRYQALSVVQPNGFKLGNFGNLVSEESDGKSFLDAELGKLALEIKYAELNRSRYVTYKYFLDIGNITIDVAIQLATVSVVESNETISEISAEHSPEKPTIAQMSGLKHTIVLRKEQDQWQIVSDDYNDFLWRTMRQKGKSAEEMLSRLIATSVQPGLETKPESVQAMTIPLLPDDTSTHAYDRDGAVTYAQNHAENYNPNYDDWDDGKHGDCTNYVSQAIYEGGNASMAYCEPVADPDYCPASGASTSGWYFTFRGDTHRASAWSDVNAFYDFVATEGGAARWNEGPEGYLLPSVPEGQFPSGLMLGDIVQYNEEEDDTWEHAAIVVGFDEAGDPLVASHSPNYSSVHFANVVAHKKTRFIHIERIDIRAPRGFDSDGIQVSYYNDVAPATIQYEVPIYWNTFTNFINAASALKPYIAFHTGTTSPAPGVNGTFWSAHWDGPLHVAQDGNYTFYFKNLDDGARVYIDDLNTPRLETWRVQGFHNYESEPIALTAGNYRLRIEYAQGPHFDGGLIVEWGLENGFREKIGPYSGAAATPTAPAVIASLRANPNPAHAPTNVNFTVKFSEPVTGVDITDFHLTTSGVTGAAVTSVSGSGAFYTVTVYTGGSDGAIDGSIRLDVLANNTIVDLDSIPLSGGFTQGETYDIDHRAPDPLSIAVAFTQPPNAATIDFLVTFSEPVTGVDVTDFNLTTTGVAGANITSVSGSGAVYTVNVNTGSGNGAIRLDILADGTILDSASMPLTTGFNSGETYTAIKNVTISGGVGAPGVTLTYFDGETKTVVTDEAWNPETWNYSITVPYGWSGTITPTKPGYSFLPASRTHANVTSDLTYQGFSATVEIYVTISGNAGLSGVRLNYVYDGNMVSISDENGNYSIRVPYGWSGTVTPSKTGYSFLPSSRIYSDLTEDQIGQDYGLPGTLYTISGNAGAGSVTLSYIDGGAKAVTADGNGNYSITIPFGWSGTVTPSKSGYAFSPASLSFSDLQGDQAAQNFSVAAWPAWAGGVSITSDQPVVTVARPHVGAEVMTYSGFEGGSTNVYLPMLFKGAFGGSYNAALYIQNISALPADLTLTFIDSAGATVYTKTDSLAANASTGYWLPAEAGLPAGFAGAAWVTSTQPIIVVERVHIGTQVMTYQGVSAGAATTWLPMFFKNGFGTYNTALYVQNVTGSSATLAIQYLDASGAVVCTDNDTLGAHASKGYWSLSVTCDSGSLPTGFVGGVKVNSNQAVVAVARLHLDNGQITTYNGLANGAASVYVPMLFRKAFGGTYNTALYLQNVSGASATVTVEYLGSNGALAATQTLSLGAGAIGSLWLPSVPGLADGFVGGARITSTQAIVAVARPHLGNEVMAYNGAPAGGLAAYLPMLFKDAFGGGYDAALYIQNTNSASPANLTMRFFDTTGSLSCLKQALLPAGATVGYWLPDLTCTP